MWILWVIACAASFLLGIVACMFVAFKVHHDISELLSKKIRECEAMKRRLFEIEFETDMPPFDIIKIRRIAEGVEDECKRQKEVEQ